MPSRLLRLGASVIAGLLLWLAFPDHGMWWTPPLAVALFALAVSGCRPRFGAALGLVFGMAFFLPTLSWSGVYVGAFPWTALALLESLYFCVMGGTLAAVQRRRIAPFVGACLWMTQEWLRSTTPFGGFPWARLAFSQADAIWAPIIAWVSAPGLTFLLALAGGALALAAQMLMRSRLAAGGAGQPSHEAPSPRTSDTVADGSSVAETDTPAPHAAQTGAASVSEADDSRVDRPGSTARESGTARPTHISAPGALAASGCVAVAALAAGSVITPPTDGKLIRVAGVQGNVPTAGLEFNAQRRAVLDNHVAATMSLADDIKAGRTPRPDVVVWPENASDIDPKRNPDAGAEITNALRAVNAPLIVGAVLSEPMPEVSNASMLYLPGRGLSAQYVKQHPVPFGEYIPYRSFFRTFSKQVDLVRADFTQGKHVGLFTIPTASGPVKLAPIICFEVAYDDLLRKPANRGAQIFAVQTNNATFGHTAESTQQVAISRLRALEYGRSIVHISTVGVSALITPDGVEHDASSLFTRKVLTGQLPLRSHATLAQRMGRAPEIVGAVISALALVWARRERRRGRVGESRRRARMH